MASSVRTGSSFRDPSGFLFTRGGVLYRQVNRSYRPTYDRLIRFRPLPRAGRRRRTDPALHRPRRSGRQLDSASVVLQPEPLTFVSYPYEWSFSQLKDAALSP